MYDNDLEQMNVEHYEQLYASILNRIDERAETQREYTDTRTQGRAQYAFGRLKDFHAFCQKDIRRMCQRSAALTTVIFNVSSSVKPSSSAHSCLFN